MSEVTTIHYKPAYELRSGDVIPGTVNGIRVHDIVMGSRPMVNRLFQSSSHVEVMVAREMETVGRVHVRQFMRIYNRSSLIGVVPSKREAV